MDPDQTGTSGGPIRDRIERLLKLASQVEGLNHHNLVTTSKAIIRARINDGQEYSRESGRALVGLLQQFSGLDSEGSSAKLRMFELPEETKKRLSDSFAEVEGTIEAMRVSELYNFINSLRDNNLPLIDILNPLQKRRSTERLLSYRPIGSVPTKQRLFEYREISKDADKHVSN